MTDYLDFLIDGVKVRETDFSQFKTEPQLREWRKRVIKLYEVISGDDKVFSDSRQDVIEQLDTLTKPIITRLREAVEARKLNAPLRNQSLVVTARNENRDEVMNYHIGSATAQNLYYQGFSGFTHASQMSAYEFDAYAMLGEDECDRQGIETLYDMFGTEWAEQFYRRKTLLNARRDLDDALDELKEAQTRVDELRAIIRENS